MCCVSRRIEIIQQKENGSSDHGCRNSGADGEFDRANAIGIFSESNLKKGKVMLQSISTFLITSSLSVSYCNLPFCDELNVFDFLKKKIVSLNYSKVFPLHSLSSDLWRNGGISFLSFCRMHFEYIFFVISIDWRIQLKIHSIDLFWCVESRFCVGLLVVYAMLLPIRLCADCWAIGVCLCVWDRARKCPCKYTVRKRVWVYDFFCVKFRKEIASMGNPEEAHIKHLVNLLFDDRKLCNVFAKQQHFILWFYSDLWCYFGKHVTFMDWYHYGWQ